MRKLWLLPIVALLCAAPACSPKDFLTRRLAADLIAGSDTFKTPQEFTMRTGVVSANDYSSPEYLVLQHRGWIAATAAPCQPKVPGHLAGPPVCWDVALTPAGVEAFRPLLPNNTTPPQVFRVPAAKRSLIEVTGISKAGIFADVGFRWKWVPMNEIGAALGSDVVYSSVVQFREYDDGWLVTQSSADKPNQNLDEALKNTDPAQ
jgi:hypothetical protein